VVRVVGAQPSLFDPSRTVERRLPSGATVRVTLEPLLDGRVRVVAYLRRSHDTARWERRTVEEGRTYPFDALGLGLPYEDVFA
jgi:hypothetical protein